MTRLTPIDTPYAYKLSELVLRVSECVEAVSEWCQSVSIDTSVGGVDCVQVSIDTGVKVSSQGSNGLLAVEALLDHYVDRHVPVRPTRTRAYVRIRPASIRRAKRQSVSQAGNSTTPYRQAGTDGRTEGGSQGGAARPCV